MESLVKMFFSVLSHFTGGQCQDSGSLCYTGTNDPCPQASVILAGSLSNQSIVKNLRTFEE